MQLSVLGLNHNTAPVEVREKMAVSADELPQMYKQIFSDPRVHEAVILSTCNRVEYYIVTVEPCEEDEILYMIGIGCQVGVSLLRKHSYIHCGTDAVTHMVRVASGLDSLVLGEPQIFGQVKEAFRNAKRNGAVRAYLNRMEQFALKTTKKVRTDTGISENAVSISYAAVDLAKKIFGSLDGHRALIIGAGEMCELAAEHLDGAGIGHITVTNRTLSKAEDLALRFLGDAVPFDKFQDILSDVDIVISSTGAPTAVVSTEMVKNAMKKRKRASMFFIDIAVPRDIEQGVGDLENVYLYDIDDLKQVVEANRKERENEAVKARELISGAVVRFERSIETLTADPLIVGIRNKAKNATGEELTRFCRKQKIEDPEQIAQLTYMLDSAMNKMLHMPTKNIKSYIADDRKYTMAEAISLLFNLKENR
ncbi:MAG: glutamyl-tRNA reductase [Deferribacteraceae bacterium]|jgi:glutamyl-tRNA reductase|nr:glutamyl-tRNA reductase [Deferribacteraceae bacterium]